MYEQNDENRPTRSVKIQWGGVVYSATCLPGVSSEYESGDLA